ncbi:hypothetical protein [Gorillibacterium sp. sgz5001074]|uniref:hypothetical protein n=1 Tax=Gorillibacterium sp. sgz5001074 TaxID=3446695 RepID=UPI003F671A3D
MYRGDSLILILLSLFTAGVLLMWLRKWITAPPKVQHPVVPDEEIMVTEAVELLEFAGYEVWTGKRKVPITVSVNDRTELETRLFIDHFAAEGDKLYIVKLARDRKPIDRTGSGLRDGLLVYQLLYEQTEGILLVDPKLRTIDKIHFSIER